MTLHILFEDNHLLAVDKPACMPAVPDASGDPSLLEAAKAYLKLKYAKPGEVFLGVVHRLDRPVSGVLLFARTSKAASRLSESWRSGAVRKEYLGWSEERSARAEAEGEGEVEQWLVKDEARNLVQAVPAARAGVDGAKRAVTRWRILRADASGTRLALEPLSGRSHQLRVACSALGLPLAGDLKYGAARALPDARIGLHASRLVVPHPVGGAELVLTSEEPRRKLE
ncbi:MAG: RluA family pseudouridine synthase [Planctomycetota bacterium]|nr:RluA family pseudouridine synthase [Planctomycetota bacterium]